MEIDAENPDNGGSIKLRRQMWTKEDELLVAKAWLHISKDENIGILHRNKEFWQKIAVYYNTNNTSGVQRTPSNIKTHWHHMNPRVSAFNQTYIQLKNQHRNGWSEDDFKTAARKQYYVAIRKDFRYEHVWNFVRNDPQWKPSMGFVDSKTKKAKISVPEASTSSSDVQVHEEAANRSVDQKSTKAKSKAKGKSKAKVYTSSSTRLDKVLEKHFKVKTEAINRLQKTMHARSKLKEEKNYLDAEKIKMEAEKIRLKTENIKMEAEKLKNMEIATLFMDIRGMSEIGRQIYLNRCEGIRAKYNL